MEMIHTAAACKAWTSGQSGSTIGFVPTMGALHFGHMELVKRCLEENDKCIVSIFVNPTQFTDARDLTAYPRQPEQDQKMLESLGVHALFMPAPSEMYPQGTEALLQIPLDNLDKVMEGASRPGHFTGVVTIVDLLFKLIQPHKAYFGEKDFQQLLVIKKLVEFCHHPTQIVACPLVREADGLAYSSRNMRLNEHDRRLAKIIPDTLLEVARRYRPGHVDEAKESVHRIFAGAPGVTLDYFKICNPQTLSEIVEGDTGQVRMFVAALVGGVRLIDNTNAPL
jgi:pantoate--beta-alanine ligase